MMVANTKNLFFSIIHMVFAGFNLSEDDYSKWMISLFSSVNIPKLFDFLILFKSFWQPCHAGI